MLLPVVNFNDIICIINMICNHSFSLKFHYKLSTFELYCTYLCINNILCLTVKTGEKYAYVVRNKFKWKTDGSCCNFMVLIVDYEYIYMYVCINPASLLHDSECCWRDSNPQPKVWTNPLTKLTLLSTRR